MPVTKSATILPDGLSYFEYQRRVAHEVVIPWLANRVSLDGAQVGDFGAHHGGTLEALRDWGGVEGATGFELSPELVAASPFLPDGRFRLEVADVMALKPHEYAFDLVILHDVLEHIPDTLDALVAVRHSLESGGRVFVSFPPYYSGYGGHQQLAAGAARVVPFVHLLPAPLFFRLSRPGSQEYMSEQGALDDMVSVRHTKLTISKAERAFARAGFAVLDRELFVVRPEYTIRYGMNVRSAAWLGSVRGVREMIVNGAFYLLQSIDHESMNG